MKIINPVIVATIVSTISIMSSCGSKVAKDEASDEEYSAFYDAYKKAETSDIIERKFLAGFEIGQTEEQVDSVVKSLYDQNSLVYFLDLNEEYVPIRDKEDYKIMFSYIEYHIDGKTFYLHLTPSYVDGRLAAMFCTIVNKKQQTLDKPIYKYFSDAFQASERGKNFQKYDIPMHNEETGEQYPYLSYVKDNLNVAFYPQIDSEEGTIDYKNVPQEASISYSSSKELTSDDL